MQAVDVFVMSSITEGLGTSILDAMAAGRPVVGTRAGGIPESLIDGETGLLVAVRNARDARSRQIDGTIAPAEPVAHKDSRGHKVAISLQLM